MSSNTVVRRGLRAIDPTDPRSAVRSGLRSIDPTDPRSDLRRGLRSLDPTAPAKTVKVDYTAKDPTSMMNTRKYENTFAKAIQDQMGYSNQARAQQGQLIKTLQDQAAGKGPSLAQAQYDQAADEAIKQTAGALASNRSLNPALAGRTAAYARGDMLADKARGSAMIRAQEQLNAREQLAQALQGARAGDIGMTQLGVGGLQGQTGQELQGKMQEQEINANIAAANANAQNVAYGNAKANTNNLVGGGLGGLGSMIGFAEGGEVRNSELAEALKFARGGKVGEKEHQRRFEKAAEDTADYWHANKDKILRKYEGESNEFSKRFPLLYEAGKIAVEDSGSPPGGLKAARDFAIKKGDPIAKWEKAEQELRALKKKASPEEYETMLIGGDDEGGMFDVQKKYGVKHAPRVLDELFDGDLGLRVFAKGSGNYSGREKRAPIGKETARSLIDNPPLIRGTDVPHPDVFRSVVDEEASSDFRSADNRELAAELAEREAHKRGLHGPGFAKGGRLGMDDPRRDTVPAMLSPGEIVLPRSVSLDEDAPDKAADFVEKIRRREGKTRGFGSVLEARRMARGGKVDLSKLTLGKRSRSRVSMDEED